MATRTPNLNLKKPEAEEFYDVDDMNGNMDILDEEIANLKEDTGWIEEEITITGSIYGTGESIAYRKVGKKIYLKGSVSGDHDITITLPAIAKPSREIRRHYSLASYADNEYVQMNQVTTTHVTISTEGVISFSTTLAGPIRRGGALSIDLEGISYFID